MLDLRVIVQAPITSPLFLSNQYFMTIHHFDLYIHALCAPGHCSGADQRTQRVSTRRYDSVTAAIDDDRPAHGHRTERRYAKLKEM